jgi:hypothetical protein
MDIKKELKNFETANDYGSILVNEMKNQTEELNKKIYLFKVLSLAKKLEEKVNTDFFKNEGIQFIQLVVDRHETKIDYYKMMIGTLDKNKELIPPSNNQGIYNEPTLWLMAILKELLEEGKLDKKIMNHNSIHQYGSILELKPGIHQEILDLFLSKELKNTYEYNKIDSELSTNNENNTKKMKV